MKWLLTMGVLAALVGIYYKFGISRLSLGVPEPASGTQTSTAPDQIFLAVLSPVNGTITKLNTINVKGRTEPRAEVFANEAQSKADAAGNFSLTVSLDEGENAIIVTAVNSRGDVAEQDLKVTLETF